MLISVYDFGVNSTRYKMASFLLVIHNTRGNLPNDFNQSQESIWSALRGLGSLYVSWYCSQVDKVCCALAGILHLLVMALLAVHVELPIFTSPKWTLLQRI